LGAANCAVEIQKSLHERNLNVEQKDIIQIRIGLHLGDVIHSDNQVMGDGVNIAARMEPLADPGCICLSEDVVRQIRNKIDYPLKYLGQKELKNIQIPFRLYQIILPWERGSPFLEKSKQFVQNRKILYSLISVSLILLLSYIGLLNRSYLETTFSGNKQNTIIERKNRIAVLPFENISGDVEYEYFADGLTEEIMSVLSHINKLRVIARTSVMKFKGSLRPVSEIAKELQVGMVLEGSIRKDGDRIRVTAQLIDTRTEEHLFAETYQGNFINIFEFQSDIAFRVAEALEISLLSLEQSNIKRQSTQDLAAYNNYLEGLFLWNKRNPESLLKSLEYFQKAIKLDPGFALAYTGVADTYHLLSSYGLLSPDMGFAEAKKAAMTAISIDEDLAQGYNSLAAIMLLHDWKWDESENAFEQSIKLNPNNIQTCLWFGLYHGLFREFDRAISLINNAISLDPVSPVACTDLGQIYYFKGQYDQAIREYEKSLSLDSNYVYTYAYLGQAFAAKGMLVEANNAFQTAVSLTAGQDPATMAGLGYVYALQKKTGQARSVISTLYEMDEKLYIHPIYFAVIHIGLGEYDLALDWLEKGFHEHSEWMVFLQVEHMLDPLRTQGRYQALIDKMDF